MSVPEEKAVCLEQGMFSALNCPFVWIGNWNMHASVVGCIDSSFMSFAPIRGEHETMFPDRKALISKPFHS